MNAVHCDCGDEIVANSGAQCANCIAGDSASSRLLIATLDEYNELLVAELNELVTVAHVHGWRSTRFDKGKELRERITQLRVSDRSENPAGGTPRNCSEERGPRNEGDAQKH